MKPLMAARTSGLPFGTMIVWVTPNRLSGRMTISEHFLQQVGQSLTVGAESIDLARQEPTFRIGRRVVGLDQSRLFQIACEIERDRIILATGDTSSGHIDVGNARMGELSGTMNDCCTNI